MRITLTPMLLILILYLVLVGALRVSRWQRRRKRLSNTLSNEFRRSPGESLRLGAEEINDDISSDLLSVCFVPLMVYTMYLSQLCADGKPLIGKSWVYWVIGGAFSAFFMVRLARNAVRRRTLRLSLLGDLAVAEELNQLMLDGCHVYHDFPAHPFNIHHVMVGKTGAFVVQTLTRSKGWSDKTRSGATVVYDGETLRFPSWIERDPLTQAKAQASWLSEWLSNAVGERIHVEPLVVIPGWSVMTESVDGIPVLNEKGVRTLVTQKTDKQMPDAIIRRVCHLIDLGYRDADAR